MRLTFLTVQNIAIAYICIWATAPILSYSAEARVLTVGALALWVAIEAMRRRSVLWHWTLPITLALVYIGYTGIVEGMLSGAEGLIRNLQLWIMLLFLVVYETRRRDLRSLIPLFWLMLAMMPIWQMITFAVVTGEDSHAARVIVRSSEEAQELTSQGVGGYGLVYATVLMLPGLIGIVQRGLRLDRALLPWPLRSLPIWLPSGLIVLNIVTGVALILTAGYSIAVITLATIVLSAILLKRFSPWRLLFVVFLSILFALFAEMLLEMILTELLPLAEGTNFALKINDILASLQSNEAVGTLAMRQERYVRSFLLFLDNPVIGVLEFASVGKHSSILDTFARFGIIIGSVFVYLIAYLPWRAIQVAGARNFGVPFAMLIAITLTFGLNNGFMAAGVMMFIVFPVALHLSMGNGQQGRRFLAASARSLI